MSDIWIFDVLTWLFFGPLGLINFLIFLVFLGIIYTAFLFLLAFFMNKPIWEVHQEVRENISSFYAVTVVLEALSAVWDAIAFTVSQLVRALVLPIKLLSGWIVNLLTGPLEEVLRRGEDKIDEAMEKDAKRQAERERIATEKYIKRELRKARAKQLKLETAKAKQELRLPNYSTADFGKTDREVANSIILRQSAERCEEALKTGELSNPAINTVATFLSCSQSFAREVRNELHKNGVLRKQQTGRMDYVRRSEQPETATPTQATEE